MTNIVVDIESDGPIPHKYSMVCFGAIVVDDKLSQSFYGETKPISDLYIPEALAVSGFSRQQHLQFQDPALTMQQFYDWVMLVSNGSRPIFHSDNNGFDWQFINYYFHYYVGKNPFGFSSQNIGSLYKGLVRNTRYNFKHLRKTKHTHNPVDDAKGNAEALMHMYKNMGLK